METSAIGREAGSRVEASKDTMRAIQRDRYGWTEVLERREVAQPEIGDKEVLVRVEAAGVDPSVWHIMNGLPYFARLAFGLRTPRKPDLGWDASGVVESVGKSVTRFQPGDEVFGATKGSFAELAVSREDRLVPKPEMLSFEEAAVVPISGVTALQAVRDKGRVSAGQTVAVIGAGGGVGIYAAQLAKVFGAVVTGVASTSKMELVRSLGADTVVDYTERDITERAERYDVIIDTAGNRPVSDLRRILTDWGTLVIVGGEHSGRPIFGLGRGLRAVLTSPFVRHNLRMLIATTTLDDLKTLTGHIESGDVRPIVDKVFPLSEAADAINYVYDGKAHGKVALVP